MVLVAQYRYLLASLTTGQVFAELDLVDVSAERSLVCGGFGAKLYLGNLTQPIRSQLIDQTTPGRCSVVILRDNLCLGEWIIWKRTRKNDVSPVELTGAEFISYIDHRLNGPFSFRQIEQLDIAKTLFLQAVGGDTGVGGRGKVAATVAPYTASGRKRDRDYIIAESNYGTRLRELSDVIDGFDYYVQPSVVTQSGILYVSRQLVFGYPRAGNDLDLVLDSAGSSDVAGNVLEFALAEDATTLASNSWAIGGTYQQAGNTIQVRGQKVDNTLMDSYGYPFLQNSRSYTSVIQQSTIDGHALSLLQLSQTSEIPGSISVVLGGSTSMSSFNLGDRFTIAADPSVNFPDGQDIDVRVLGWTLKPPASGPELVELQIVSE